MSLRAYGLSILLPLLLTLDAQAKGPSELKLNLSTSGNDIAFDKSEIEAPFGNKIKIKFLNQAAKGSEILHNVVIIRPGTYDAFVKDLQASGYDLEKMRKHPALVTMTKMLSPGDEDSITFEPTEPGAYPYLCIMAGHSDMLGMKGILQIKK